MCTLRTEGGRTIPALSDREILICCRGFYTVHAHPHVTISLQGQCVRKSRGIFQLAGTQSESSTKVATWRIWGRAVSTSTCMSLMPCSGRAYQPPYQDRPVLFSSMDESVTGAARQGGTGQMTKVLRPLYIPDCKTALLLALSRFVFSLPHPNTRLRNRAMQKHEPR